MLQVMELSEYQNVVGGSGVTVGLGCSAGFGGVACGVTVNAQVKIPIPKPKPAKGYKTSGAYDAARGQGASAHIDKIRPRR